MQVYFVGFKNSEKCGADIALGIYNAGMIVYVITELILLLRQLVTYLVIIWLCVFVVMLLLILLLHLIYYFYDRSVTLHE